VKIVLAVVEDDDAMMLMDALIEQDFGATKLASTGGFLLRGNTTMLVGIQNGQVDQVIDIIRRTCKRRKKLLPHTSVEIPTSVTLPIEIDSGGAIVFVLDVSSFQRL
jgi:uncharacterized protein YaaQ